MFLTQISLQNFRNYTKSKFEFSLDTTLIIGANTSGKTNLMEAISFLSTGRSFRTDKDEEIVRFGESIARISGEVKDGPELGAIIQAQNIGRSRVKKYLVNGVSKNRSDFAGNLIIVLFSPVDLDIIINSPLFRRRFLDNVLGQVDREYRMALVSYAKGLRQRNSLLEQTRESGIRNERQFEYWDNLLIDTGTLISKKREEFIEFINDFAKDIFDFATFYDKSVISKSRLIEHHEAEVSSGVTLVGPHRDDISFYMYNPSTSAEQATTHDIRLFGSRGEQRITVLQLKLIEISYIEKKTSERPILILDDIFSELDQNHIKLILEFLKGQQSIITATHKEFFSPDFLKNAEVIELGK